MCYFQKNYRLHMKNIVTLIAFIFVSMVTTLKADDDFQYVKSWYENNNPVILIKEVEPTEWGLNKPYFVRNALDADPTVLVIGKVVYSTSDAYKAGTLVLFEGTCDTPEKMPLCGCPYILAYVGDANPPLSLTEDNSVIYYYPQSLCAWSGAILKGHEEEFTGVWKEMAHEVSK